MNFDTGALIEATGSLEKLEEIEFEKIEWEDLDKELEEMWFTEKEESGVEINSLWDDSKDKLIETEVLAEENYEEFLEEEVKNFVSTWVEEIIEQWDLNEEIE